MKKILPNQMCCILALFALCASNAFADFVSPRVGTREKSPLAAASPSPEFLHFSSSNVWFVTNNHDDGFGSLRRAISNAAPGGTIKFAFFCPTTIVLSKTLLIEKDLKILGPGPNKLVVARTYAAGAPSFRVFTVDDGVVTIAGMTIVNGRATSQGVNTDNLGGGIRNLGTLTVSNCVIAHNVAPTENTGNGFGGGIFTIGPLTILNSTVRDNEATFAGGGICTFHCDNFVGEGCTINDNLGAIQGGGVNHQGIAGSLKNCTISRNSTGQFGTASALLHIAFSSEVSALSLASCTITRNGTNIGGAMVVAALPGNLGITTRMINTLVADNEAPNFFLDGNPVLQSLGNNLDSDGTSGFVNGVNGDIVGTLASPIDALLSPLRNNGGSTLTHALLSGSPALDAGACEDTEGASVTTDQRGLPRPQGAACDIGAFENQPPVIHCPDTSHLDCNCDLAAIVNDPDGDALNVVWIVDSTIVQSNLLSGTHPPHPTFAKLNVSLSQGPHTVTLRVSDGKSPVAECFTAVIVGDSTPPRIIDIKANPRALCPANNKLVPVKVYVRAVDSCSPVTSKIVSVESSDPVTHGPDWVITGDLTLLLRAERASFWRSRVYTITVQCRDASGNKSYGKVHVVVANRW